MRFCNLVAIQLDWTGSQIDCLESVIQPQSPVVQKIVSALSGFWQSRRDSIWFHRLRSESGQSWDDRWHLVAIRFNCVRIASNLQSRCNRPDCGRIATVHNGPCWGLQDTSSNPVAILRHLVQSKHNPFWLHLDCIKSKIWSQSIQIADMEVSIARGLWRPKWACFGDCGAPRGLQRTLEHLSRPALESGTKPDGQPLG